MSKNKKRRPTDWSVWGNGKAWRWTRFRRNVAQAFRAGKTLDEVQAQVAATIREAGAEQKWRRSELALTLAHRAAEVDEVARRVGVTA